MFKVGDKVNFYNGISWDNEAIITEVKEDSCQLEWNAVRFRIYKEHLKPITPKPFTKDDLKDGMVCVDRKGIKYIVWGLYMYDRQDEKSKLQEYDKNLLCVYRDVSDLDIMTVKTLDGEILWQREDKKIQYKATFIAHDEDEKKHSKTFEDMTWFINWYNDYRLDITLLKVERVEVSK